MKISCNIDEIRRVIDDYYDELYVMFYNPLDFSKGQAEQLKEECPLHSVIAHPYVVKGQVILIKYKELKLSPLFDFTENEDDFSELS